MTIPESAEAQFTKIYSENRSRVKYIVASILRSPDDIDDVAQDVWTRLWQMFAQEPDRGPIPRSLVDTVAKHTATAHIRHLVVRQRDLDSIDAPVPGTDEPMDYTCPADISEGDVRHAMACLPPDLRELVSRHYIDGESIAEIGKACGLTHSPLESRMREALQLMRAVLNLQGEVRRKKIRGPGKNPTPLARKTHETRGSIRCQATAYRERLSTGHLVWRHRHIDRTWLEVSANEWQTVCRGTVRGPAPEREQSVLGHRYASSKSAQIRQILDSRPDTPPKTIASIVDCAVGLVYTVRDNFRRAQKQLCAE